MDKKLEQQIVDKFPELFDGYYNGDIRHTLLPFGFEISDGWYNIVLDLATKIHDLILNQPKEEQKNFVVLQVKEKYASLRVYLTIETDEMSKVIREAEEKSEKTCEICGKDGSCRVKYSWYKTLCNKCGDNLGYKINE